jgi:hypothetical protein
MARSLASSEEGPPIASRFSRETQGYDIATPKSRASAKSTKAQTKKKAEPHSPIEQEEMTDSVRDFLTTWTKERVNRTQKPALLAMLTELRNVTGVHIRANPESDVGSIRRNINRRFKVLRAEAEGRERGEESPEED